MGVPPGVPLHGRCAGMATPTTQVVGQPRAHEARLESPLNLNGDNVGDNYAILDAMSYPAPSLAYLRPFYFANLYSRPPPDPDPHPSSILVLPVFSRGSAGITTVTMAPVAVGSGYSTINRGQ